jgi:hypothetical protein
MAEQHILDGERNIMPQKELIAEMGSLGLDVSAYRASLAPGADLGSKPRGTKWRLLSC